MCCCAHFFDPALVHSFGAPIEAHCEGGGRPPMTDYKRLVDKRWIAIGKSLPFSIYDSQRKLLLAQGHVVESARSLERLLEQGQYYKPDGPGGAGGGGGGAAGGVGGDELMGEPGAPIQPLAALNRDYANIPQRARCGIKISPRET